jgi:hypothetical protein
VAVVASLKGDVKIVKGDRHKALSLMAELNSGDRLAVGTAGEVRIVFYGDTHSEIVRGDCLVRIETKSCVMEKKGTGSIKEIPPYKGVRSINPIKSSSDRFGGFTVRSGHDIDFSSLVMTLRKPKAVISTFSPTFEWAPIEEAPEYFLEVEDAKGGKILDLVVTGTTAAWPVECPALASGSTYFWSVEARREGKILAKGSAAFRTISEKNLENLKAVSEETEKQIGEDPADPAPYVIRFSFSLEHGLIDDAFDACLKLSALVPEDRNVHRWLGTLYEWRGMLKEAKEELRKAGAPEE